MSEKQVFEHEQFAADLIAKQAHTLLFDAMGVGKTISVLNGLKKASGGSVSPFKCVVCAPNTIIGQWSNEVDLWLGWDCVVVSGDAQKREIKYRYFNDLDRNCVLIVNYSFLIKDKFISTLKSQFLILDEGYLFRNANTKVYQFLKHFVGQFDFVSILSGNLESFSLRQLRNVAGLLFEIPDSAKNSKESIIEFLGDQFIARRLKDIDVPFAVQVDPEIISVSQSLNSEQEKMLADLAIEENVQSKNADSYSARKYYNLNRQVLLSPRLIDLTKSRSPKENYVLERVHSCSKTGSVVVYCPDAKFFKLLKKDFIQDGTFEFVAIDGSQSIEQRKRSLNLFRLDENVKCLLISGVGKFGLNLQTANTLICVSVPVSKFDLYQMIGRLIRLDQEQKVTCYIPYHTGTAEESLVGKLINSNS